MTEPHDVLRSTETVLVVDWPSRDVPDTLVRGGFSVVVHGGPGPEDYFAHELVDGEVAERQTGRAPEQADLVYSYRPIDELPGIVEMARTIGAKAVWCQSGLTEDGAKDPKGSWMPEEDARKARQVVESAGLTYIDRPYIADAVRSLGTHG